MVTVEQPRRLRIELQLRALVVERLDTLEQLVIEIDRVVRRRELGRCLFLHFLQSRVGVRAREGVEVHVHAREELSASLESDERILECWRSGIIGDALDFGELLLHPLIERRRVVGVADLVERRRLVRERASRQQRVLALHRRPRPAWKRLLLARRCERKDPRRENDECATSGAGQSERTREGIHEKISMRPPASSWTVPMLASPNVERSTRAA